MVIRSVIEALMTRLFSWILSNPAFPLKQQLILNYSLSMIGSLNQKSE